MRLKVLIWSGLMVLLMAVPQVARAELGCNGGCPGGEVCANFPSSTSVSYTSGDTPEIEGCRATANPPVSQAVVDGISYCTGGSIFDGMEYNTVCSSSAPTPPSKWFHWLTGSLEDNAGSVCLLPGDHKTSTIVSTTCTTTSTPLDPVSTTPPEVTSGTSEFRSDEESFDIGDFHLEAAVDCSDTQTVYSIPHDVTYDLASPNYPSNYDDNYNYTWTITHPGAVQMAIHFDNFYTEGGSDYIQIYDGSDNYINGYSGNLGAFKSTVVDGDTIKVAFTSDGSVNYSGWHIDSYTYYEETSGTLVAKPAVTLYYDAPSIVNYDFWGSIYRGSTYLTDIGYTEIPTTKTFTDDGIENNNTYRYNVYIRGDNSGYYFDMDWQSEYIDIPINCADPAGTEPQLNTGYNVSAERLNSNTVNLSWDTVNDAKQYYVTRNGEAIYSASNWTNYYLKTGDEYTDPDHTWYFVNDVIHSTTNFLNYSTTNTVTDSNANLSDPDGTNTYRVYAVVPQDWDNTYTWNTRYPWDHNLVLSEEVIVHADGSIEETDTDPIDEGGSGTATCNQTCSVDSDCITGLSCVSNMCRKTECTTSNSCSCSFSPSETSSITDHQSNTIAGQPITTIILYDIRTDEVITDGSIKITFPEGYDFSTLTNTDVTVEGGNVTWGTPIINSGDRTIVVPFTGELSRDDDRITITIGGVNYLINPTNDGTYLITLTTHDSIDGTGPIVDQAQDEIEIQDAGEAGKGTLSDTLSVSLPGNDSRHTIRYNVSQTAASITNGSLKVTLDSEFDMSGLTDSDITIMGGDVTWSNDKIIYGSGAQIGWWQKLFNKIVHAQGENSIVFNFTGTLDGNDETITIVIGDDNYVNNPFNTGSFSIDLTTYSSANASGDIIENLLAKVYINGGVTVTATVPSSLMFTVLPVADNEIVNGATTNVASTSSLINFGIVEPNQTKIAAQDLQVATNASSGFVVTLQTNNTFASAQGNTIATYSGSNSAPTSWTAPSGSTHGYFGYTTDDYTLGNTEYDRFASNNWAGATTTPSEIMYHNGSTNGTTQGQGTTRIGYELEIDNLQPAGIYSTNLMYICTATF